MTNDSDLWVEVQFADVVLEPARWIRSLESFELASAKPVTRLGRRDRPPKRLGRTLEELAAEVVYFGPKEESTTVFGELEAVKGAFTIDHRRIPHALIDHSVHLAFEFVPQVAPESQRVAALGSLPPLAVCLNAYYGYADTFAHVKLKKLPYGAVRPNEHLTGIFWLTWFGPAYVEFFGRDRLMALPQASAQPNGGVLLKLGESPEAVPPGLRREIEVYLGEKTFADANDPERKPPGKYALTLDQIRAFRPAGSGE